ncbi:hypothetical protein [Streptomyces bacillaris]|uniref:hypothetical protein n=1 Tax=Streptomyces bacillaris TaxID=68179 RepID=UPI003D762063
MYRLTSQIPVARRERFHPAVSPENIDRAHDRIRAAALLTRAGRAEGAGDVAALGDLLVVGAEHAPAAVREKVRAVAAAFEQAARAPAPAPSRAPPAPTSKPPPAPWNTLPAPPGAAAHRP